MANVGEQLLQPESGWIGFDDSNINIKYDSNWMYITSTFFYNSTIHYCHLDNGVMTFYVYGTKIRIFGNSSNAYTTKNIITIDGNDELLNCYSDIDDGANSAYQRLLYEKLDLEKKIHKIEIKTDTESGKKFCIAFDRLDIDEDGYMVYCDDNGKLYYDVTPIMTSNTMPDGYEVSASTTYASGNYSPYKVFDGINNVASTGWASAFGITKNQYITLKNKDITMISNLMITTVKNGDLEAPKRFDIQGSNDNSQWITLSSYNVSDWSRNENGGFDTKFFKALGKYQYYRLFIYETNGSTNVASLSELRYLLAVDTPFYLIQDNSVNKIYNYDEENNSLIEVTDISILNSDALNNTCIYDLTKVIDLIDLTDENITILSNQDAKLIVDGIKNDKELIVSNQNLSIVNAETIHNFLFDITKVSNGSCKFVISADDGQTWITWNGSLWNTLTNTAPLDENNKIKQYSKLSDSEKVQWNKLKEEIWTSGMSTDIADVDYSSILTNKAIRFAFVLYRPTYDDNVALKDTQWLFNRVGAWHKLSEDDIDIAVNSNMCTVTPKLQNLQSIKVNILI